MFVVGVLLLVLGSLLIYWSIPYSPYKASFNKEMESKVDAIEKTKEVCTAEEIAKLPEPFKRYCEYIGLEGFPKYQITHVFFPKTKFVFNASTGKIIDMDYDLWLFNGEPYRSAYCNSSLYAVPLEGIDYCTEEKLGGMKGMLGKIVQIFDEKDEQGYKAILITWLAESAAFNPSVLLSPYVSYETMDENHVKATITYNGVSGSGIFTINEEGQITEFYSDERQVEEIDGIKTLVGWRCEYRDYEKNGELQRIHTVRGVKVFPDKEVVYFDSNNFTIEFVK